MVTLSPSFLILGSASEGTNSPANGNWELLIQYTKIDNIVPVAIPINFLVTCDTVQSSSSSESLKAAEELFASVIAVVNSQAAQVGVSVNFWTLLCRVIVGYHWKLLNDLGQISPTTYGPIPPQPLPDWYQYNFSQVQHLAPTNNIFVNKTLFDDYSSYIFNTVLPLFNISAPTVAPLEPGNELQPRLVTFSKYYSCQMRQFRAPAVAIISIGLSVYFLIKLPFAAATFVVPPLEEYLEKRGLSFPFTIDFSEPTQGFAFDGRSSTSCNCWSTRGTSKEAYEKVQIHIGTPVLKYQESRLRYVN